MSQFAGSKIDAVDFKLPVPTTGYGNGTNVIVALVFTDLPTTGCAVSITNPHPTANMLTLVTFGGWLSVSANAVRICPRVSGSVVIGAGIGGGGPVGHGEIPLSSNAGSEDRTAAATYELPPGTATFTMQAMRDSAAGTQNASYCTIRLIPLRFEL